MTLEDLESSDYNDFDYSILTDAKKLDAPNYYYEEEIQEPSDIFNYLFDAYSDEFDLLIRVINEDKEDDGMIHLRANLIESVDFFSETELISYDDEAEVALVSKGTYDGGDEYNMNWDEYNGGIYSYVVPEFYEGSILDHNRIPISKAYESEYYELNYVDAGLTKETVNDGIQRIVDAYGKPDALYVQDNETSYALYIVHVFEEKMIITEVTRRTSSSNPDLAYRIVSYTDESFTTTDSVQYFYIYNDAERITDFE